MQIAYGLGVKMAIEKSWPAVAPQLLTVDGNTLGVVNVASTAGFKVKQTVTIANGAPSTQQIQVQVKRVVSSTQLIVGPLLQSLQPPYKQEGASLLSKRENISAYTVVAGAYIYAAEQPKAVLTMADIVQAVYRQEPGTTIGVELDDEFGNPYNSSNPLPVAFDGTIEIGEVEVIGSNGNTLEPNPDGSLNVVVESGGGGGTIPNTWSDIKLAYDSNNNLIQVQFYSAPSIVERTLTLSYDSNDNLTDVLPS